MLMYRAVPVRLLCSLYAMCFPGGVVVVVVVFGGGIG